VMTQSGDSLSVSCGVSSVMLGITTVITWMYFREFWPVSLLLAATVVLLLIAAIHYKQRRTTIRVRSDSIVLSERSLLFPVETKSFAPSQVVLFVAKIENAGENVLGIQPTAWALVMVFGDRDLVPLVVDWDYSAIRSACDNLPESVQRLLFDGEGILNG
jgi:hypothetical protein